METETLLKFLFSSMKNNPSNIETFETIYCWIYENNVTDELKTILLSQHSLESFQTHLNTWNPEKPTKATIKNLNLILFLSEKLPELKCSLLSESGYFSKVLNIYFSCLRFLTERKQKEIDENCSLSLVFSKVSKYANKFCIKESNNNTLSSIGQLFFEEGMRFLIKKSYEFARNPNNCVYLLTLMNTMSSIMSQLGAYKSLFVDLNGIEYCLKWLSKSYKDKRHFFHKLYYDLRILSILETFVDDPYFAANKTVIGMKLIKYLRCNGEWLVSSFVFIEESKLVFNTICSILIKMTMRIEGSRQVLNSFGVKQLMLSFFNKCRRPSFITIYTTVLVLEEIEEDYKDSDLIGRTDIVMSKLERFSNILSLSKTYNISLSNEENCSIIQ